MSRFHERLRSQQRVNGNGPVVAVDASGLPELFSALQGEYDEATKCWTTQPYTLTVWMEGPLVKFCLGAGQDRPKFFSSFAGLDEGFEKVETCLVEGRGDWKAPGGRRSR